MIGAQQTSSVPSKLPPVQVGFALTHLSTPPSSQVPEGQVAATVDEVLQVVPDRVSPEEQEY